MSFNDINFVHELSIPKQEPEEPADIERAKHVLLYIATRVGNGVGCWASQETMAEEMAMPLRAVERAIQLLKRLKLIKTTRRSRKTSIIKVNTSWVPPYNAPPVGDGSLAAPIPSSVGGSELSADPPTGAARTASQAADKHNEHAGRSRRTGVEAVEQGFGSKLDKPASVSFEEEPISDPQPATLIGASFIEIPMLGPSFEQKAKGAELATPGSGSHLDGGSPGAPSLVARQPSSPAQRARDSKQHAPPIAPIGRKPVLPQIEDQELYNRLTKRSPR
ncbi:helix-turn-helix domain-containing protein [Mesorhizobium sp. B2-8-5]|uniref:helix-turn-helix domain-containing protein n=1 Tax=Mesorhizobium sp. B2-8-5 TaxID=2589903 RepID=UPI00112EDEFA|nr:helix-turn-helix domain-containing protein [Mesorhizobium sp. B2-8-5]UCI23507.1 helix-turn-helix domain-containing protein [Mesorhizobium sp. B2-8-5]